MTDSFDVDQLVDTDNGVISRELFVNRDIFEAELERVFTRAWLLVGHEGLIPEPDDYFVSRMGKDSVMRNLATLNQLWDGADIATERRTTESFTARGLPSPCRYRKLPCAFSSIVPAG